MSTVRSFLTVRSFSDCACKNPGINFRLLIMLLRQLRLFLDKNNCLQCGGRIHNAPLNQISKFPFLLLAKHSLTIFIIHSIHSQLLYAGTNPCWNKQHPDGSMSRVLGTYCQTSEVHHPEMHNM